MADTLIYVGMGILLFLFMGGAFSKPPKPLSQREWEAMHKKSKDDALGYRLRLWQGRHRY